MEENDENADAMSYSLTNAQGRAVQEVLRRYIGEELKPQLEASDEARWSNPEETDEYVASVQKDIDYIEGLAKLFD